MLFCCPYRIFVTQKCYSHFGTFYFIASNNETFLKIMQKLKIQFLPMSINLHLNLLEIP